MDNRKEVHYTSRRMIESFRHRGLHDLFVNGSARGVPPGLLEPVRACLSALHVAKAMGDLDVPGWWLRPLPGRARGWTLVVDGPWRITFGWGEHGPARIDLEP